MEDTPRADQDRENLRETLTEALWDYEPLRNAERPLELEVHPDGAVRVAGAVQTRVIKETLLEILENQPGVQKVVDDVHADPDIELAVARKLSEDPRTSSLLPGTVQVYSHSGVVSLVGRLMGGVSRELVAQVVEEVEGVQGVVDRLNANGA